MKSVPRSKDSVLGFDVFFSESYVWGLLFWFLTFYILCLNVGFLFWFLSPSDSWNMLYHPGLSCFWISRSKNMRGGADRVLGFTWQGRDVFQMERLGASNLRRGAGLYLVGWLALCLRRGPEGRTTNSSYPKRSAFSLTFSSFGLIYWEIVLRWSEKSNTAKGSFQNLPKGTRITKQQQPHPAFALYYEPSYML